MRSGSALSVSEPSNLEQYRGDVIHLAFVVSPVSSNTVEDGNVAEGRDWLENPRYRPHGNRSFLWNQRPTGTSVKEFARILGAAGAEIVADFYFVSVSGLPMGPVTLVFWDSNPGVPCDDAAPSAQIGVFPEDF